jgi:hypothetical protein
MRLVGLLFLGLSGYYLRFYLLRGDPLTLIQMAILLAASALLVFSRGLQPRWRPVAWYGWLLVVAGVLLAVGFVVAMDRDSHSVADTLNRAVPTLSLWLALGLRLRAVPARGWSAP